MEQNGPHALTERDPLEVGWGEGVIKETVWASTWCVRW